MNEYFDVIIIGSGAGGGTLAYALSDTAARILIVERGDFVPQEAENWDPEAVWKHRRYQTRERWSQARRFEFLPPSQLVPYTHYCVGGNTKFWGSALFRLRREDFDELDHVDGGRSPKWPIDYDTLEPYYERAEHLYAVRGSTGLDPTDPRRGPYPYEAVPHAAGMGELAEQLRDLGLHPSHLPLGVLEPGAEKGCELCRTCNSFPCRIHAKSEADIICVRPAIRRPNVTLWTNSCARRLIADPTGKMLEAVEIERNGEIHQVRGSLFVVACGAVNSAALLLRSTDPRHGRGLANASGLVGRRYMAHQATLISGRHPSRKNLTEFQKTLAINDFYLRGRTTDYPLGQIQSQGRTHPATLKSGSPWYAQWVPEGAWKWWADNAVDWLAMSEDLPDAENRVTVDAAGRIHLRYRQNNVRAHKMLVAETKRILAKLGFSLRVQHSLGVKNTTHQCGTVLFGTDPARSVLDPFCRTHDVKNLFVVDASFFPSSGAVNPGLTIIAQALRTADHIKDVELSVSTGATA